MAHLGPLNWRYQPVWQSEPSGDRHYTICEIYVDDEGRLSNWTQNPEMRPSGSSQEELGRDLIRMYVDAACWEPVDFATLRVGMKFTPLVSKEQRRSMADMFDLFAVNRALTAAPPTEPASDRTTSNTEDHK